MSRTACCWARRADPVVACLAVMAVPKKFNRRALAEAVLGPDLKAFVESQGRDLELKLGSERYSNLKLELGDAWELLQRDPAFFPETFDDVFQRWHDELVPALEGGVCGLRNRARVDEQSVRDFGEVMRVAVIRAAVRKNKRLPELGRPYAFFRECLATRPSELLTAFRARNALERNEAGDNAATERRGVEHLRFLTQIATSIDDESIYNTAEGLSRLWASAYGGPVRRVCRMLWFFASACCSPGETGHEPPQPEGNLFIEVQRLLDQLGCSFPFTPRLNDIRNASSHGGQLRVRPDGRVEYLDRRRTVVAAFTIDQLHQRVSRDVWFAVVADQALVMAAITWADDLGMFDESVARLRTAVPAAGLPEPEPPAVWLAG